MIGYPMPYAIRDRFRRESLRNRFGIPRTRTRTNAIASLHASLLSEGRSETMHARKRWTA